MLVLYSLHKLCDEGRHVRWALKLRLHMADSSSHGMSGCKMGEVASDQLDATRIV